MTRLLLPLCLLAAASGARGDSRLAYAPDIVGVGRMFMVALKVPTEAPEIVVTAPACVELFDRTRLPARSEIRKFYFRALRRTAKATIRFALPKETVPVSLEIWSFEDLLTFRTLKGTQLPRRWPLGKRLPELKRQQTYPTGAEAKEPEDASRGGWLDYADDDIWAMQPDSTIPRWHWTNLQYGCPVHGREIYRKDPYYPWIKDGKFPWRWKIKCPVGGEEYPSNDFGHGDMTGGEFADDGIGGACLHDGKKYAFVAELCQFYCHRMLAVAPECAERYAATGDAKYAHKALVALCRLAQEYAYLATMTQHRHRDRIERVEGLGAGRFDEGPCLFQSGFTTYCIDQPGQLLNHAQAYDRIFPVIDKDPEIVAFLQKQGFAVKTHEDVRRFIEENLFAVWMQGIMDGACESNEPNEQRALAYTATVLNYARGEDFMHWLYDGPGQMRTFVTNAYFRDGAPYETTGVYNATHVDSLGPVVEAIERLRRLRPETYPEWKYPTLTRSRRYRNIYDYCMDTVTIDRGYPQVGDDGSWPRYEKLPRISWHDAHAAAFEHAWRMFRDPKFAWALARSPAWKPADDVAPQRLEIEREADQWPDAWNDRSSLHDGYGLAILRSGQGDAKRALWMWYGHVRHHGHDDILDIGLQERQGTVLAHMGYPRNWSYWEGAWSSHNVARQFPHEEMSAQMELFAEAQPVRLAEVRAQAFRDRVDQGRGYELPADDWQRRLVVLVDVYADRSYGLDFYRVSGGKEHWRAFHCQEGDFTTQGIDLSAPAPGTLAGPDVPYADSQWLKANCSPTVHGWSGPMFPFAHFYNVQRGTPSAPWSADWKLKTGDGLHFKLTVLGPLGMDVCVCDGRSPAGASPYEMKWVLMHSAGESPVRSQVQSVFETYAGTPLVRSVKPVSVSGPDEQGFAAYGCEVQLAGGTDHVFASADASVLRRAGPFTFAGRFGLYRERKGIPWAMTLVGGTKIGKGSYGVSIETPEYRGHITQVDRDTETITIQPSPPDPKAMIGTQLFIANSGRRIAYRVLAAKSSADAVQLRLQGDSRIGTGRVCGVGDHRVVTDTRFPLQFCRYYQGARLVNAQQTAEYQVLDARDQKAVILDAASNPPLPESKLAREFPLAYRFDIYDYGAGDEVIWPYVVRVTCVSPGQYLLSSPVPAKVHLPPGSRLSKTLAEP